jgi:hypothetical protein
MTFTVGEMIVLGAIEPALELKRLIAAIASHFGLLCEEISARDAF